MNWENLTSKQQGNIGMSHAIQHYTSLGYCVSIPLTDSQEYDLIVDDGNQLKKVQVRTTRFKNKNNSFTVSVKSCGGTKGTIYHRVADSKVDELFVLTSDLEQYVIPKDVVPRSTISLCTTYQHYKV